MLTDRPPRKPAHRTEFLESDRLIGLALPEDDRFRVLGAAIESAMRNGRATSIGRVCAEFLVAASDFYGVRRPEVRALAARPLRVREGAATELFGDYTLDTMLIRIWTRTAVHKRVTSIGTFLSTLCHEFCHHLDCQRLGFRGSPHTRGFYERTAVLYHHTRGTPMKRLSWVKAPGGRWRIDWSSMNRARSQSAEDRPGALDQPASFDSPAKIDMYPDGLPFPPGLRSQ